MLIDSNTKQYISHNKKLFSKSVAKENKILLEMNEYHSSIISYSYLSNILAEKFNASITAYRLHIAPSTKQKLPRWVMPFLYYETKKIYLSFGVRYFLFPVFIKKNKVRAQKIVKNIIDSLQSKKDIEEIEIDGVIIGDLIYDTYLKISKKPTIDVEDKLFLRVLLYSIEMYIFWCDYFNNNQVKAVVVSHCVYNLAIPLRIALQRNIDGYQVNATHLYRLNSENMHAYNDFKYYHERFQSLPIQFKEKGIKRAQEKIKQRFAGKIGVDMRYSRKSAYSSKKYPQLLEKTEKFKILVATHCFFDSPHSYGFNLFPDFYEWVNFLSDIAKKTDYEWYFKTHPDYIQESRDLVELFVQNQDKFYLLPADSSHHQIIQEGIGAALTVYGTIGFEYAALGIPVINASLNNPHISYKFNLHPKTVKEYEGILLNIEDLSLDISNEEIAEFYYMRYIYNTSDWLFLDYDKTLDELGDYREQFTPKIYLKWLEIYSDKRHKKIIHNINKFISSNEFRFINKEYSHY